MDVVVQRCFCCCLRFWMASVAAAAEVGPAAAAAAAAVAASGLLAAKATCTAGMKHRQRESSEGSSSVSTKSGSELRLILKTTNHRPQTLNPQPTKNEDTGACETEWGWWLPVCNLGFGV